MSTLLAIPILGFLLVLQTAVASRLPLLHGTADLILLAVLAWSLHEQVDTAWRWGWIAGGLVAFTSALPFFVPLAGYLFAVMVARLLTRRVWQTPILAMLLATLIGTAFYHLLSIVSLQLAGDPLPFKESLNLVTLPSLLLNLLLALPMYALVHDLVAWAYPMESGV